MRDQISTIMLNCFLSFLNCIRRVLIFLCIKQPKPDEPTSSVPPTTESQLNAYKKRKLLLAKRMLMAIVGMWFAIVFLNWTWQYVRKSDFSWFHTIKYGRKGIKVDSYSKLV